MKLPILNQQGQETGAHVTLDPALFDVTPNDHAVWLAIRHYRDAQRQGTAQTKERWAVVGSTKKLRKQKGSGNARVGDAKSPLRKGGGRTFGPTARDYNFKLNKKQLQLARKIVLSDKARSGNVCILEDYQLAEVKTKAYRTLLANLGLEGKKTLLVLPGVDQTFVRAARNLQRTEVTTAQGLHTYAVLHAQKLIISANALAALQQS